MGRLGRAVENCFSGWGRCVGAVLWLLLCGWGTCGTARAGAPTPGWWEEPGVVILLRHALAPGFGDPAGFRIDDCRTQRNLSEAGREQARAVGAEWRRLLGKRAEAVRVFTSQWCRCRETAELLGLGTPQDLPALNSFFQRPGDREDTMRALRAFLAELPIGGDPVVLVTHQVNITALTGRVPRSGQAVAVRLNGTGEPILLLPEPF